MAKGNLFLGMGRGSVGDVTFYRADGQQLSRVRNRRPRNPKTQAQLYQRAIMATIVKAYQAGQEIFDHSFQGYSKGSGCQRQFIALNAKMLRALVAADVNENVIPSDCQARVIAPKINTCVANSYIISRGSYPQRLFNWNSQANAFQMPQVEQDPGGSGTETVAAYAERVGLVAGDIYTLIILAERGEEAYVPEFTDDSLAFVNYCDFGWVRFIVKDALETFDSNEMNYLDQIFEFQGSGGYFSKAIDDLKETSPGEPINMQSFFPIDAEYTYTGAMGVIRSRLDQDLRSDSNMVPIWGTDATDQFGIASSYILDVWGADSPSIGHSELILEGGDV